MAMPFTENIERNRIAGLATGFFLATFVSHFGLTRYWISIASSTPLPSLGRIYRHNERGSITWFTAFESTASTLTFWIGMFALFVAIVVAPKRNFIVYPWSDVPVAARWDKSDPAGKMSTATGQGFLLGLISIFVAGPPFVSLLVRAGLVLAS
jgi:hypothetical protein